MLSEFSSRSFANFPDLNATSTNGNSDATNSKSKKNCVQIRSQNWKKLKIAKRWKIDPPDLSTISMKSHSETGFEHGLIYCARNRSQNAISLQRRWKLSKSLKMRAPQSQKRKQSSSRAKTKEQMAKSYFSFFPQNHSVLSSSSTKFNSETIFGDRISSPI